MRIKTKQKNKMKIKTKGKNKVQKKNKWKKQERLNHHLAEYV